MAVLALVLVFSVLVPITSMEHNLLDLKRLLRMCYIFIVAMHSIVVEIEN